MRCIRNIGSILLLLLAISGLSQDSTRIDSLARQLELAEDSTRVDILNQLAEDHLYIDHEKIYDYARQALELSTETGYRKGIAIAYNNLGTYYRTKGIYDESIDYYFNALAIMEELHDETGIARAYNLIGILYYYLENYELSLEYYQMAMELNLKQNDVRWIAGNSNNIGMILELEDKYEEAMGYYIKSLEMNIELGNKNWIANNYGNIGSLYLKMNKPEQALESLKKRLAIKEELNDIDGIARSNFLLGTYYMQTNQAEEAIHCFEKAHDLATQSRSLSIQNGSTKELSKAYASLPDYFNALKYEKLNKTYNDSLKLASNMEKITRLQMKFEHKKNQQMTVHRNEKNRIIQRLLAVALLFILVFIVLIYNRQRIKGRQHAIEQNKLRLGNKLLQEELDFKENMLQDNITYLLSINELLTDTINQFNELKQSSKPENHQIIKEIVLNLQSGINDDIWEEFELRFNQIHKDFYKKLNERFPELSANDKKLCAFLKLNMTTREISAITSLSVKSLETARSRLRKKLQLQNKSESLSQFLNNF